MIFHVEVASSERERRRGAAPCPVGASEPGGELADGRRERVSYSGGGIQLRAPSHGRGAAQAEAMDEAPPATVEQRRVDEAEQIGRNDPCWCGSGKKFKKCHGA
jgi:preprotein translocase subunit SecA